MTEWIFLYGPPGVGKSFLGRKLAKALNLPFWDLDGEITSQARRPISTIFSTQGESGFRALEQRALRVLLSNKRGVLSLGGGALLDDNNRALVEKKGAVLLLTAKPETLLARLQADENKRPLLRKTSLSALLTEREDHYGSFSLRIATEGSSGRGKDTETLLREMQIALGRFRLTGMGDGYDVVVRAGALDELGPALRARGLAGPLSLVTDVNVGGHYAFRALQSLRGAGYRSRAVFLSPGEKNKNMVAVQKLWDAFLEADVERGSTVVALGGGVVGDLAGFAAASFLRGVSWVNVPTSLLAMVDASIGGKTGVDLPQGKNLVGAFHAPRLVWVDTDVLSTLPEVELRNGLAEVVKHGVIGDLTSFQNLTGLDGNLSGLDWSTLVRRALAVKVGVVQADPYEQGVRASLNFGHTIGHAVELASGFSVRHGEAVAIGMVAEARLAEEMGLADSGLADEISAVLRGLGLPTEIPPGLDIEQMRRALLRDKKKSGGVVRFSLPVRVGEVRVGVEVEGWGE